MHALFHANLPAQIFIFRFHSPLFVPPKIGPNVFMVRMYIFMSVSFQFSSVCKIDPMCPDRHSDAFRLLQI